MENEKIVLLKHQPTINVKFSNAFYTNQVADNLSDYLVIDVTSRARKDMDKEFFEEHPNFDKESSPFYIGSVVTSDGTIAHNFELMWQCGKVYPCHDNHGKPNEEYFKWRNECYAIKSADHDFLRHPSRSIGFENRDALYFAYFDKNLKEYIPLDYIASRKKVYFPEYAKLVVKTDAYKFLKSVVDAGKKLALVDFDAYNYYYEDAMKKCYASYVNKCKKNKVVPSLKEKDFTSIKTMKDAVNCPFMAFGHAGVLKALLQGDLEVVGDEVIDHAGILN